VQIARGKDGELKPYVKQAFDFVVRIFPKAALASLVAAIDIFNTALDKAKEAITAIGSREISLDIDTIRRDLPEVWVPVERLLKVKGVELVLAGNAAVDIAVFKATGVAPSTLYGIKESMFALDDNVKVVKTEDGKLILQVLNGGRNDFERKQLSLTDSVKKTLETGDTETRIETLAKVLAKWARYNASGFNFEDTSQDTVVQALFSIATAIEARTNIRQLEDSIDALVAEDTAARMSITAFIHPDRGIVEGVQVGVRREVAEKAKVDLMKMRELADYFALPAAPEITVAPAIPAAVVPPTVEPAILVAPEEELPSAVSPEHMRLMAQWMQSQKVDIQGLSDKAALSMQELRIALAEILEQAGSYEKPVISGFDLRAGRLDDSKVIGQIKAEVDTFEGRTVRHVIVVDKDREAQLRADLGDKAAANVQIVVYDEMIHANIIEAFNTGIGEFETDRGITIDRSLVALALTESDAPAVREYYDAERATPNGFNFLVVNPDDEHIKLEEQGDMLPTLNLVGILARLAVKAKPTVMTVACSEATIMDLEQALKGMLNFI
ncbi:MAG: hypothetical protein WBC99_07555, partial [Candidatus Omnitrophota bacterium]